MTEKKREIIVRKLVKHANLLCVVLTGLAWLVTLVVRFLLLKQQLPPGDWLLWVVCNNLMIAGFAYQLGVLSLRRNKRKWFRRDKKH